MLSPSNEATDLIFRFKFSGIDILTILSDTLAVCPTLFPLTILSTLPFLLIIPQRTIQTYKPFHPKKDYIQKTAHRGYFMFLLIIPQQFLINSDSPQYLVYAINLVACVLCSFAIFITIAIIYFSLLKINVIKNL